MKNAEMPRRKAPFQSRVGIAENFYFISKLENELWKKHSVDALTEYKRPAKSGGSSHKPAMTGATFPGKKRPLMRTELTQLVLKQIV